MKLVNFTEENLSKIHISQFRQFLDKYGIQYNFQWTYKKIGNFVFDYKGYIIGGCPIGYNDNFIFDDTEYYQEDNRNFGGYFMVFANLLQDIYKHYTKGDLTQFHVLFTQVYNEIMGYPIINGN